MAATQRTGSTQLPISWQQHLRESITTPAQLLEAQLISPADAANLSQAFAAYRFALPRPYAALIDKNQLDLCPIHRQAVPRPSEADPTLPAWACALSEQAYGRAAPWQDDAIGDVDHLGAPRLTHRYGSRALLHVTSACAMYCRFCFRKSHLKAKEAQLYGGPLQPALGYLSAHPEIDELILTGGDPLSMSDAWLTRLLATLADLPQLRTIRLHSRMATTLPSRLDAGLWQALKAVGTHQQVALVSHFNHPRELTSEALEALGQGRRQGVLLLNQATLLWGVNSSVEVLQALCQKLWHGGVVPYYLHHPDWTPGTFAFRVTIDEGRALMRALAGRVSGPALPSYVLDVSFGRGKVRLMETQLQKVEGVGVWDVAGNGGMVGGLWHIKLPHTRNTPFGPDSNLEQQSALYLDLAAARVDHRPIPL